MFTETCAQRSQLSERGARDEFEMHGVLSGVVCCEGEHPTLRDVGRSLHSRSFILSILFSVPPVFVAPNLVQTAL